MQYGPDFYNQIIVRFCKVKSGHRVLTLEQQTRRFLSPQSLSWLESRGFFVAQWFLEAAPLNYTHIQLFQLLFVIQDHF